MTEFKRYKPKPITYYVKFMNHLDQLLGIVADNPSNYIMQKDKRIANLKIAYCAVIWVILVPRFVVDI